MDSTLFPLFNSARITESNPVRDVGPDSLDYERCAALHNELLTRAIKGTGREMPPNPQTWWEVNSPPEEIANCLKPPVVEFLKRAWDGKIFATAHGYLFYYLAGGLAPPEDLIEGAGFTVEPHSGRFIKLYHSSCFRMGDDEGLLFDQHTMKATFIEDYNDTSDVSRHEWSWMPLEVVLEAYLQMIDEGKVEALPDWKTDDLKKNMRSSEIMRPWVFHQYTKIDVDRAVSAFQRLVNAIDARVPGDPAMKDKDKDKDTGLEFDLPWRDPVTLAQDFIPPQSFAHEFLSAISSYRVRFWYIAPGLRFPTVSEFLDQPIKTFTETNDCLPGKFPGDCPLRIFQTNFKGLVPDDHMLTYKPPGFYIQPVINEWPHFWSNGCRLLLPFSVGKNGWARMSNGEQMGMHNAEYCTNNVGWNLYQAGFTNGFTNHHFVQIDKVLNNWAERVEKGDWEVNDQGVSGGIEMFREADTEEHWGEYWIAPGW